MEVGQLLEAAGVSRTTFYEDFVDLADCVAAAQAEAAERLRARMREAWARESEWPLQVRASVEVALGFTAETPALASLLLPTSLISEPRLAAGVWEVNDFLTRALRAGSATDPQATLQPELGDQVLVSGAQALIGARLRAGDVERLPLLAADVTQAILAPYVGAEIAREVARGAKGGRP